MSNQLQRLLHGRGSTSNFSGRYEALQREVFDDGWGTIDASAERLVTTLEVDHSHQIITYNSSPDIPFDRSINLYRGCEHGCIYCFARPSHAWFGLSPGQDFESRLFYKPDAARVLRRELGARRYHPATIALGANTDAYQPVERKLGLTREILRVLEEHRHPVLIVTKSALIERDIDILARLSQRHLVEVAISLTTLDTELARRMEPRASSPRRRLKAIQQLRDAGIPVTAMPAPGIPGLNDVELEQLLNTAKDAGASNAHYTLLRLPLELRELFDDWLQTHYLLKHSRVMNQIRVTRNGALYDASWPLRMQGSGVYAEMIKLRFQITKKRLQFPGTQPLDVTQFLPTPPNPRQLTLLAP